MTQTILSALASIFLFSGSFFVEANAALAQTNYIPYTFVTFAGAVQQYTNTVLTFPPFFEPQEVTVAVPDYADGVGTNAHFYWPSDVAVSTVGVIFVADQGNNIIRRITRGGRVTTIAGSTQTVGHSDGVGTNAAFFGPHSLALDNGGNIYVADTYNDCIRKLKHRGSHWEVVTIAGSPATSGFQDGTGTNALFQGPGGIAVIGDSIFVADTQNDCIRRLTRAGTNWKVTTIAGTMQFTNINGITYRTSGYADGIGTNALFSFPNHIAADGNGNLYVTDSGNHVIRRMRHIAGAHRSDLWEVTTIAGAVGIPGYADGVGTNALFRSPLGIALDRSGDVYVGDSGNFVVRKLSDTREGWTATTLAGVPGIPGTDDGTGSEALFGRTNVWPGFSGGPAGIAVHRGKIYVADLLNSTIRKGKPAIASETR